MLNLGITVHCRSAYRSARENESIKPQSSGLGNFSSKRFVSYIREKSHEYPPFRTLLFRFSREYVKIWYRNTIAC